MFLLKRWRGPSPFRPLFTFFSHLTNLEQWPVPHSCVSWSFSDPTNFTCIYLASFTLSQFSLGCPLHPQWLHKILSTTDKYLLWGLHRGSIDLYPVPFFPLKLCWDSMESILEQPVHFREWLKSSLLLLISFLNWELLLREESN